jgi:hypothetical protein
MSEIEVRDANGVVQTITTNDDPATGAQLTELIAALRDIAPVTEHVPVVPDDNTDLVGVRGLKFGSAGTVVVRLNGVDEDYDVEAGEYLPLKAERVLATGTTVTKIKAWK